MNGPAPLPTAPSVSPAALAGAGWSERMIVRRLQGLRRGRLTVRSGPRTYRLGQGEGCDLAPSVRIVDPRFWSAVALRGSLGAAEAYADGWWTTDDLTAVVRLFVINDALWSLEGGWARLSAPLLKVFHGLRRNTRQGSRKNIAAHYDLSNDFFALFLDPTMTYSAGIFAAPDTTLEQASLAKIDRLCRKLELRPSDHLLEIGTGWGALAIHAAREYGCRVTTTTISRQQHALAQARIAEAGLGERITLLLSDYRDLRGTYDKLVSVEMIEAVGHEYYDAFFAACGRLLAPHGQMALQAITMADHGYEQARRSVDFIQRYIFPGSCIPSVTALSQAMARSSDLRLNHLEDMTPHYATTLRRWRERFLARLDDVRALGFDDWFIRLWEFYLAYCEAGFAERHLGSVQLLYTKPACRREPLLPALP